MEAKQESEEVNKKEKVHSSVEVLRAQVLKRINRKHQNYSLFNRNFDVSPRQMLLTSLTLVTNKREASSGSDG